MSGGLNSRVEVDEHSIRHTVYEVEAHYCKGGQGIGRERQG